MFHLKILVTKLSLKSCIDVRTHASRCPVITDTYSNFNLVRFNLKAAEDVSNRIVRSPIDKSIVGITTNEAEDLNLNSTYYSDIRLCSEWKFRLSGARLSSFWVKCINLWEK